MAILKCKMCGGALAPAPDSTIAECEYCGSLQTLPRLDDDRLTGLYERANALRLKCEFDKAEQLYEKILQENDAEPEAHWGIVLCKYGIEYVEDPKTFKRIPTCHRTSYDAVTADTDYLAAIAHADAAQRSIYEAEAKAIDEVQKNILSVVKDEKPFDVFLCYKETDENGKRTVDSAITNDIYYQLTKEGLKVFYAAITLEDKLGQEYEPYIFAALNSAKVMLVIGTKPEYFNAVWVKNEWSRFLKLMKKDRSRLLIPCYKDMDAYELPEEFAHLQAQDMSKIGFINDIVRGIEKLVGKKTAEKTSQPSPRTTTPAPTGNIDNLLQRVGIFLEDQDWSSANIYCEKVLDIAPTNGKAYLYKLLAEARVTNENALKTYPAALDSLKMYRNAVRYADENTAANLTAYNQEIKKRLEEEREQARIAEEYRRKGDSLVRARNNAANLVASQVQEKEQLEELLSEKQYAVTNLQKYRRRIIIPALICIVFAIVIFISMVENTGDVGPVFWLFQFVPAMFLAHARGRSKLKAFFQVLFTIGLFPFFSALKALLEVARTSSGSTQNEQEIIKARIREMEDQIDETRKSLSELNSKIEEHAASKTGGSSW